MTDLISKLQWRYATKKFAANKSVPPEKAERIIEAMRLAPTSDGLQPFELIVITNRELRSKLQPVANGQSQIMDCSHLLVLAAWADVTPARINMMFDLIGNERGVNGDDGWESYRQSLLSKHGAQGSEANFQFSARQSYIALGAGIVAAALENVDSTPIGGFDPAAVDDVLGLKNRQLRSVGMLALGYRDEAGDWLVGLKKVRRARTDFVIELS